MLRLHLVVKATPLVDVRKGRAMMNGEGHDERRAMMNGRQFVSAFAAACRDAVAGCQRGFASVR
jgi:hypothetical protein